MPALTPAQIAHLATLSPQSPDGPMARIKRMVGWRNAAKRELPHTELIGEPGPWMSVSECPPRQAYFQPDEQSAERTVARLSSGCGGRGCRGSAGSAEGLAQHYSFPLDPPGAGQ